MSKVNKLGLTLNENQMYLDMVSCLIEAVSDTALELLGRFKMDATEAIDDLDAWVVGQVTFDAGTGLISAYVGSDHWSAFLDNYGTGSKMDKNNPFLDEYKRSNYFNTLRPDSMAVVARRKGELYASPNYKTGVGIVVKEGSGLVDETGRLANLEELINPRTKKPYFIPRKPKHWLEKNMVSIGDRLIANTRKALNSFPYHRYLKGGG